MGTQGQIFLQRLQTQPVAPVFAQGALPLNLQQKAFGDKGECRGRFQLFGGHVIPEGQKLPQLLCIYLQQYAEIYQFGRAEAALLQRSYDRVSALYPEKCRQIEECLKELSALEKRDAFALDEAANLSARMLGVMYRFRDDIWADTLERMGQALGRFIYLMDAYDDLDKDIRKNRFNALRAYRDQEDYETFVKESLTLLIAECTDAFETLPLVQDMDILRNILYSGCWTRYRLKQAKRDRKNGVPANPKAKKRKEDGA